VPAADLIALGVDPTWARDNGGLMTWTFEDGIVTQLPAGGAPCQGDYASVEGQYVLIATRPGQPCGLELAFRWRPESDGISFVLMPPVDSVWPLDDFLQVQAHLERRVWTRIAEAPSSDATGTLPPLGTFRAEITAEDLERRGAGHVDAVQDAGVVTVTFHGDRAVLQWDRPLDGRCEPSYGIVGDVVRFVFTGADGCEPGTYDLTFTVDGDVLRPVVVATEPPDELDATRAFFERDWLSID
jgi:hypothetical protein